MTTSGSARQLPRRRLLVAFFLLFGVFATLGVRLFWLQVWRGAAYASAAAALHTHVLALAAPRGEIVDRNGTPLALSLPGASVFADPAEIHDPEATARRLATILDLPEPLLAQRLARPSQFVWLEQAVPLDQAQAVEGLHLPGIYTRTAWLRGYPEGMFLGHVLGFTGLDGHGLAGVELSYDRELSGRAGYEIIATDATGRPLPATVGRHVAPKPGLTLRLTIDGTLQWTLARDLEAEVSLTKARQAWGIVMDPQTGAILALSSWPSFDPAHFASVSPDRWVNPVVTDTFPPGSVFKPVTAAAALSLGLVAPTTPFSDPGVLVVDGVHLHDFQRLDQQTNFQRAFEESSNVVFGHVGLAVGIPRFYDYLRLFGLFAPTGVDLPGEARAPNIITPVSQANSLALAEMAYGESLNVTPLSLITALNAIANGGRLMEPHVGFELLDANGRVVQRIKPRTAAVPLPPAALTALRGMMIGVVRAGTGQRGFIPCYDVAGKTGTSNLYVPGGGIQNEYYASFYGFAPADKPRVAALVTLVAPQGGATEGGEVAAPVVQNVLRTALHRLAVPASCTAENGRPAGPQAPDATPLALDMVPVPAIEGLAPGAATARVSAAGLTLALHGSGSRILRQSPPPGSMAQRYTPIDGYTTAEALEPGPLVAAPNLVGDTLEQAAAAAGQAGLNLDELGVGRVFRQSPLPGTPVPLGSDLAVELRQSGAIERARRRMQGQLQPRRRGRGG